MRSIRDEKEKDNGSGRKGDKNSKEVWWRLAEIRRDAREHQGSTYTWMELKRGDRSMSLNNVSNSPLNLFGHYSDSRFANGNTITVYGLPSGRHGHAGLHYNYSDRLWQHDYQLAKESAWIATETGATVNSPRWLTIFLSHYYGKRVELRHVLVGVNVSNGYHYNVFGTVDI